MTVTIVFPRTAVGNVRVGSSRPAVVVGKTAPFNAQLDTSGNVVPVWKPHTFTYDSSGNLSTDTVKDGPKTWVRTYMWTNGAQTSDSGWVKQNG